jgi:MFS family permease
MDTTATTVPSIQWKQLLSLTALYASVIIGWIAYYNYQPQLLEAYNFTDLTLFLFISQGIILCITPMIAGHLGDKFRGKAGMRLPIISAGISLAAMIFMSVAFTLFMNPSPESTIRWILPGLVVVWLFSMALFTSPAISTIELFVPVNKLPSAMAVLTIVYGLLYAIEPVIVYLIEHIGATMTFVVGGVAVFGSGLLMKKNTKSIPDSPKRVELGKSDYSYALFLGIAFGLITTLLHNQFPIWLADQGFNAYGLDGDAEIAIILGGTALFCWPISRFVEGRATYISVLASLLLVGAITGAIYFSPNQTVTLVLLVLFAAAYAMMSVSYLPLALSIIKDQNKVFGVGVFFAGGLNCQTEYLRR